jgi:biotin carboxylase
MRKTIIKQKALIHIGASDLQMDTIKWAKECGLYVVATDLSKSAPGASIANEFHNISGTNVEALLELAENISKKYILVGVYCNSDFYLEAAAQINKKYRLFGCYPNSLELSINKAKAKEVMFKKNIPLPIGFSIKKSSNDRSKLSNLKFPIIVKPVDSCGSQGVKYVYKLEELNLAIANAFNFSEEVMLEEFVQGEGIDTIGIMKDGKLYPYGLGARVFSELPYRFPIYGYTIAELTRIQQEEAYRITEAAAIALGIINGPVKGDLIFYKGSFTVIEITPRFHGDVFTNRMIVYSTGIYPVKDLFNFFINGVLPETTILDAEHKIILWKGLFSLEDNFNWSLLMDDSGPGIKVLDYFIDSRYIFSKLEHKDNTSLVGFIWLEFDSKDSMNYYLEKFKSKYNKQLL